MDSVTALVCAPVMTTRTSADPSADPRGPDLSHSAAHPQLSPSPRTRRLGQVEQLSLPIGSVTWRCTTTLLRESAETRPQRAPPELALAHASSAP